MLETAFFYMFGGMSVLSGMGVVLARNTMHSVMFLIFCFFNASGLFFLLDAEFLGIILILLYVGAVMVLFMFVIMMLEVNAAKLREGFLQYLPLGALIGLIVLVELAVLFWGISISPELAKAGAEPIPKPSVMQNTAAIGAVIYTKYIYLFQAAGMILFIAMIGAIVLTLRKRPGVKRQNIMHQNTKVAADAI